MGDWNVDQLPTFSSNDPFADIPNRSQHHFDRRCVLTAWADSLSLKLFIPSATFSLRGGAYDDLCLCCPITRVPTGCQEGLPACLDYAFASSDLVKD